MNKKTFLLWLLSFAFLFGCVPNSGFPQVESFYISPFDLTAEEKRSATGLALSPDGETIAVAWIGGHDFADLRTGERIDLWEELGLRELNYKNGDVFDNQVFWSFDGRYLGMQAKHYGNSPSPTGWIFYKFDLQTKTAERYEIFASAFSPFDSNQVLTNNGVYNLKDGTTVPFLPYFDFTKEQTFGATYWFDTLWSKNLGIPVATLNSLPYDKPTDVEIAVESFSLVDPRNPKYSIPIGFSSNYPNHLAGYFFDPTGEYILVAEWQCKEDSIPCSITPLYTDNVYDTVLTLVHWRTQEKQELIRISEIDPEHVVAYGYMDWSADGSTIFISRKDALPVVLKLKYP